MSKHPLYVVRVIGSSGLTSWIGYTSQGALLKGNHRGYATPLSAFIANIVAEKYSKIGCKVDIIEMGIRGAVK